MSEPGKLLRVEPWYFREYAPWEGTSITSLVGATTCSPAINGDGGLEPLRVSLDDAKLVVLRGGAREAYVRLAETPPELRLDLPRIEDSREITPDRLEEIRRELKQRHEEDQAVLKRNLESEGDGRDYEPLRRENNRYLQALLDEAGWIDSEVFGARTTYYAFMLLQHSRDFGLMLATAPYIERDLKNSDYSESYALFFDRLQVLQGRPQRYGTQMMGLPDGQPVVFPIEDPEGVDERRRSIGLPPLEEYLDLVAEVLHHGRRPVFYDPRAISAALSPGGVEGSQTACIQAVFFDLGNTLMARGTGDLFVARAGAQETVDQLQAAGVQVGVITNVPADWTREDLEAILAEPAFLDELDVLVLSSEAPAPKPDSQIYLHAHGLLPTPVAIGEVAFVGETLAEIADAETTPTSGARAVGMIGIHLSDDAPSPLADYTVPTAGLTEIMKLREDLCATVSSGGFD